jgi:iron(III) transport system substrate-binding protein
VKLSENRSRTPAAGRIIPSGLTALALLLGPLACGPADERQAVIYTSLDQTFSEQILREFEARTGIRARAVYDTEAAKTTGLVNRLLEEQGNPRADVFWNSEIVRTIVLKRRGVLAPYRSPAAAAIPERFKDPEGFWTGFGARVRVLVCNTERLAESERPRSIFELAEPRWRGKVALANPMFGTTATHGAALFAALGEERAGAYFRALKDNAVAIVAGNATSKDRVAAGEFAVGFTDTDDVNVALARGQPVATVFPDQEEGGLGTLLIPNTVALVRGGPHPEEGKRLVDFILSEEVEGRLAAAKGGQIPLRSSVPRPERVPDIAELRLMDVDFEAVADQLETSAAFLRELFLE